MNFPAGCPTRQSLIRHSNSKVTMGTLQCGLKYETTLLSSLLSARMSDELLEPLVERRI